MILLCQSFRNQTGVEHSVITPGTNADHAIIIFDLPGIDLIHFFATVLLTGPFCRTVVLYCLLGIAASGTNCQLRFVWVGSDDHPFPAPLFTGFCVTAAARSWLLRENRHPQRTHQRGHQQQIDNSFQFAIPPFLQTTNSPIYEQLLIRYPLSQRICGKVVLVRIYEIDLTITISKLKRAFEFVNGLKGSIVSDGSV